MSKLLISQYHAEVDRIVQFGGSRKETSVRKAFCKLLNAYCEPKYFLLIPELDYKTKFDTVVYPDGTVLHGVPQLAWGYRLGNRSALEWVLDQYKEKKPRDPTIREKFNTYRFADYKEQVIDLLMRVCTVSVKTMEIIQQMDHLSAAQGK